MIYAVNSQLVDKSCTVEKLPNEVQDGKNKLSRKAKTEAKKAIQEKMKAYEEKKRKKRLNAAKKKKENKKLADIRWHGMSEADKFAIVMEAMEGLVLPQYVAKKHGIQFKNNTSCH